MKSHIGTASHLPESHLFQMLFHQPTAQICPPVQDRLTAGLSWLLGAEGSKILCSAHLSPHPLCCHHATDTPLLPVVPPQGTVRAPQHAPSLGQKIGYKGMARPTQTEKQGLRGRMHLPLTVQAPAGPQSAKKQRKAGVNGVAGVQSHSQCLCPASEAARAVGSPALPEQLLALLGLSPPQAGALALAEPGKAAPSSAAVVAQDLGNRYPQDMPPSL